MATHIKDIIGGFFINSQSLINNRKKIEKIVEPYIEKVGGNISLVGVEGKNLIFHSASSSVSYNFSLNKEKLIYDIQRDFPHICEIRIKTI